MADSINRSRITIATETLERYDDALSFESEGYYEVDLAEALRGVLEEYKALTSGPVVEATRNMTEDESRSYMAGYAQGRRDEQAQPIDKRTGE